MFSRKKSSLIIMGCLLLKISITYAATHEVSMIENVFVPETLSIERGDTVLWINNGSVSHTATSGTSCTPDGLWDSGFLSPGNSFSFAFDSATDYPYFCIPHCNLGMTGLISVLESGIDPDETDYSSVFKFKNTSPNLFSNGTEITYELNTKAYLNISIYSIDGQSIITLFNGIQDNGIHSVSWKGKNKKGIEVSDGIYFCLARVKNRGYLYKIIKFR